jgi:AsmA protein
MTSRLARRGLLAVSVLLIAGLLLVAALPLIASTQIVRDRIASELSAWSGYRVTLGQAPAVSVWPSFRAYLTNVELTEWREAAGPPVIEAEEIELDLSPLAALRGEVSFSRISLVRPLVRVRETGELLQPEVGGSGGRLMRAIEMSRAMVASETGEPDTRRLPDTPFGTIEFTDGRIAVSENGRDEPVLTSLAGRIYWPTMNRSAQLSATGIWRGESISVEASSSQPLLLLAGRAAPLNVRLGASPASISFEGTASLYPDLAFEGMSGFSSPSLRRFLEWSQTEIAAGASIGSLALSGHVTGSSERLRLSDVEIDLNGDLGNGVLDLSVHEGLPAITGTLAFRSLDLRAFLATFTPVATGRGQMDDPVNTELASQINLDLRLSAANAVAGDIALTDVAASVQVKEELAAFDISDANVFDGTVQAGLRIDRAGSDGKAELRLHAENIDAGELVLSSGVRRIVPQARANLSLIAKGQGPDWNSVLSTAEGTLTAALGEGTVVGFDLRSFLSRSSEGEFFGLAEVAEGRLPISGAQLRATVENGVLRIDRSEMRTADRIISVEGIVPYLGRALALSGQVTRSSGSEDEPLPLEAVFFIGGGWDAPFVSPVLYYGDVN